MKKKYKLILLTIVLIVCLSLGLTTFYTNKNRLSKEERAWLTEVSSKIQNINVSNDKNIFGKNGEGLFYTFIKNFQDNYGITLNTITYKEEDTKTSPIFGSSSKLPEEALEFYKDHYVYISKKKEAIESIKDFNNQNVGILKKEESNIAPYFQEIAINYQSYETNNDLLTAFKNDEVQALIVPRIEYIDTILQNNYYICYHFSDIPYYYYMDDVVDSRLKSIMKKYYATWSKKNLQKELNKEERQIFTTNLKIEEKDLVTLQSNSVSYGLVNNSPYEILSSGNVGGIMTEYIKAFSNFSGIDIDYTRYNNPQKFIREISNNKVKLYMNYFTQTSNGAEIDTNIYLTYSIYAHESNPLTINTLTSLKDYTIYVEENTLLATELQKNSLLNIQTYNRKKDWNKIIKKKNSLIAIDQTLGKYYEKHDLKKYHPIYQANTKTTYSLKSMNNEIFNNLLTKYLNYLDNNQLKIAGMYHNSQTETKGNIISNVAEYAFYFILIIGIILLLIYYNGKKVRLSKKIKKEDKLKYIDQLTSLKNRNYLNENITAWNKNTIYPQSVIMIDLKKLQEINDTLGYEEGDKQIQAAANILIRTQLDNTDIIRTDGTEFMVYLIGYNQKQITSYMHKLNKEFSKMPYEHGVIMDYSMIENELKNIQDAINECVEGIKKQKEEQKEEKNE